MDRLHKKYQAIMAKKGVDIAEKPEIIELDNEKDRATLDSHIDEHFEHVGSLDNGHVDGFLNIRETTEGLEADVLVVYANGTGKSFYFESKLDEEKAREVLKPLSPGEEIHIYAKGSDYAAVIEKLRDRLPLEQKHTKKKKYSPDIRKRGGYYTVDVKVREEEGLHMRPLSRVCKAVNDNFGTLVYFKNNKNGREASTESMLNILFLELTKNTLLTLRSEDRGALELAYDHVKHPEKYEPK